MTDRLQVTGDDGRVFRFEKQGGCWYWTNPPPDVFVGVYADCTAETIALLSEVVRLRDENKDLRRHLDKRAAGTDPLTEQLRATLARVTAERDGLRTVAVAVRCLLTPDQCALLSDEMADTIESAAVEPPQGEGEGV